ncbi:MAG: bifunctional phosphoribosylaminoimidazolecarboxamide formyltransferase/IMP cyclohydrolase [Patescibacteria group bacterium]
MEKKKIKTALISVFNKEGLTPVTELLKKNGVKIISTGGTAEFIRKLGADVTEVESLTNFPSVFGGRVKTLHPAIFGGILNRRDNPEDQKSKYAHKIEDIDLVIVDLYPFEEKPEIETIDIGGVSLIRAAAKNYEDVVVISSREQYKDLKIETTLEERKKLAGEAFARTSSYDFAIREYFQSIPLRYGENPHQNASFVGDLTESFSQLHGKELSYNNLLDTEAVIAVINDFKEPAFAIVKHMNTCGLAVRPEGKLLEAYQAAYAADPVSAFGGILAANREIGEDVAKLIREQKLFVEVVIAPGFSEEALKILEQKKDCRILLWHEPQLPKKQIRSSFTGMLVQDRDMHVETEKDLKVVTTRAPTEREKEDLLVAAVAVKHLKSNAIALVKDKTLISMGCGQTARVDALKQAIEKAKNFGLLLEGAVMASEAFFPFPDCVEIAGGAGISAVIQPGGSKNDQASIDMANKLGMAMATTGYRHFKH